MPITQAAYSNTATTVTANADDRILLNSVGYLASRGFHAAAIAKTTGLTKSQVTYRVKACGLRLRDYRDGITEEAQKVVAITPCIRYHVKAKEKTLYKVKSLLR